jgi:hypothetical protein
MTGWTQWKWVVLHVPGRRLCALHYLLLLPAPSTAARAGGGAGARMQQTLLAAKNKDAASSLASALLPLFDNALTHLTLDGIRRHSNSILPARPVKVYSFVLCAF